MSTPIKFANSRPIVGVALCRHAWPGGSLSQVVLSDRSRRQNSLHVSPHSDPMANFVMTTQSSKNFEVRKAVLPSLSCQAR